MKTLKALKWMKGEMQKCWTEEYDRRILCACTHTYKHTSLRLVIGARNTIIPLKCLNEITVAKVVVGSNVPGIRTKCTYVAVKVGRMCPAYCNPPPQLATSPIKWLLYFFLFLILFCFSIAWCYRFHRGKIWFWSDYR